MQSRMDKYYNKVDNAENIDFEENIESTELQIKLENNEIVIKGAEHVLSEVSTVKALVDVKKMIIAAELFMGKHDFKGFSSVGRTKKSTVRTINYIQIKKEDDIIKIIIKVFYNFIKNK